MTAAWFSANWTVSTWLGLGLVVVGATNATVPPAFALIVIVSGVRARRATDGVVEGRGENAGVRVKGDVLSDASGCTGFACTAMSAPAMGA